MRWDYADRLYSFYIQTDSAEPSQYVQYCYDAAGNRVMKISRVQGGSGYYKCRIYIGSIFEEYYEVDQYNVNQGYQDEIMIMDNQSKIASKRMGTTYSDTSPLIKYIFPDHLGSSNVQCDDTGSLYNREEYYPFGETSFGSYGKKRYRYCGKERDEESGMYYNGARYYLPWTCRFVSVDPLAGKYPFHSSYLYAHDNPIIIKYIYIHQAARNALLFTVIDVKSRLIMGWKLAWKMRREDVIEVLSQVFATYRDPLKVTVRNDNGSQFEASMVRRYLQDAQIIQEFTQPATPQQNGHIESYHSILERSICKPYEMLGL